MRADDATPELTVAPAPASDQNAYLIVSLYLLLLAFFIVLYTSSRTDSVKADRAIGSVYDTFRLQEGTEVERLTAGVSTGQFQSRDPFLTSLNQIFEAEFPLGDFALVQNGKRFEARLAIDTMFVDQAETLRPAGRRMVLSMAAGLAASGGASRFEVEIVLPVTPNRELAQRRAAHIADQVRRAGAPAASITAGLLAGGEQVLINAFRRPALRETPAAGSDDAGGGS